MKKFLFVDLDDTLFQTLKKCQGGNGNDLRAVAFLKDGAPISYMSDQQRAMFEMLMREMTLIPTTARNRDALSRVDLAFTSYAIIDYGGVILQANGEPDPLWLGRTQQQSAAAHSGLQHACSLMDEYARTSGMQGRARLVEDYAIPFYALIKDPEGDVDKLAHIDATVLQPWVAGAGQDFYIHRNGNNLAVLPKTLNKAHAVAYLQQQLRSEWGRIISLGMGDSRSDASFLRLCDYAILPHASQLGDVLDHIAQEAA